MKTRSLRKLLKILRDNEKYFENGLCVLNHRLCQKEVITKEEYYLIKDFMREHQTQRYRTGMTLFYWPLGEWEPRKKFLDKWIKKLSK